MRTLIGFALAGIALAGIFVFLRSSDGLDDGVRSESTLTLSAPETTIERSSDGSGATEALDRQQTERRVEIEVTRGGHPVSAEVILIDWRPEIVEQARSMWGLSPISKETSLRRMHTNANGRLTIDALPAPFVIGARAKGCSPTAMEITSHIESVSIELENGARIAGAIYDESERPIDGAAVGVTFDGYNDSVLPTPLPPHMRAVVAAFQDEVIAGMDGKYEFDGLLPGVYYQLGASAPGYVDCIVPRVRAPYSGSADMVLMRGAASVRGRVVDEVTRKGLPFARVSMTQSQNFTNIGVPAVMTTDESGEFIMARVAARATLSYVDADAPGYGHGRICLPKIEEGSTVDVEIPLRLAATFRGKVKPIGGATLDRLEAWAMNWEQKVPYDIVPVSAEGDFEFTRVPEDTAFVVVVTRNRDTLDKAVALTPWQQPFEIVLNPRKGLHGRLIAESYPLPGGSKVRLASEGNRPGLVTERFIEPNLETGEFVIPDQRAGTYFFDAFVPGYAVERIAHIVHDPTNERQKPLEVTLRRGAELVGTVRDSSTGKPIEGAVVELADVSPMGWDTLYGHYLESCRVRSDGDGRYRYANVDPEAPIALIVSAEGYGRRQVRHVANPHERSVRLDIPLDPASRVIVRAIRPDGAPARRFYFSARCDDKLTRSVSTENGVAEMNDLIAGTVKGDVDLQDVDLGEAFGTGAWQTFELEPGGTKEVVYDFSRGATIRGQVRSTYYDHIPNSQTIIVRRVEEDGLSETSANVILPNQRYAVYGVPAGKVRVELSTIAPGPDTASERILDVEDGQTYEIDFVVSGAALRGFVRDASGAPIAGARVRMRRTGAPSLDGIVDATVDGWHLDTSKLDGSVELIGLLDGLQEFEVSADGFGRLEGEYVFAAARSDDEWTVRLDPEAVLGVRAADRAGQPVEDVRVRIRSAASRSPTPRAPNASDADRFEFRGLGTGDHVVSAEAPGWFPAELVVPVVAGAKQEAKITMRRPSTLWLKFLGPNGELLARSPVNVVDLETGANVAAWCADGIVRAEPADLATNEKAEIRLDGLPEGRYRVTAAGIEEELVVGGGAGGEPKTLQALR